MNQEIADRLRQAADLLEQQDANPFRVGAYRRAADTVEGLDRGVDEILEERGSEGLEELPGIGSGIAGAIREIVDTGRWAMLERLRGDLDPERLFRTIPGVGPELARRIHDTLGVDTLESLEIAAHDGRLRDVEGIGPRRAASIRAALQSMLGRARRRRDGEGDRPSVAEILDVDRKYRRQAEAGELPTIAPRRFNPEERSWLPILHTDRGRWHFTALYSNSARAHELGKTRDWVVIYFYDDDDHEESQATVVTETRGPLEGERVVRGRERECREHYAD